jgi:hypothetical protein
MQTFLTKNYRVTPRITDTRSYRLSVFMICEVADSQYGLPIVRFLFNHYLFTVIANKLNTFKNFLQQYRSNVSLYHIVRVLYR